METIHTKNQLEIEQLIKNKYKVNHILHLLLSIFTGGTWLIVWFILVINNNSKKDREIFLYSLPTKERDILLSKQQEANDKQKALNNKILIIVGSIIASIVIILVIVSAVMMNMPITSKKIQSISIDDARIIELGSTKDCRDTINFVITEAKNDSSVSEIKSKKGKEVFITYKDGHSKHAYCDGKKYIMELK